MRNLLIPRTPPSANSRLWRNWRTRYNLKCEWECDLYWMTKIQKIPAMEHVTLSAVIYFPDRRRRDLDNYEATLKKMVQDGLVKAHVIPDDTPEYVTWTGVSFDFGRPRTEVALESR